MPTPQAVNPFLASPLIPMICMAAILYFIVMRPEKTKQNERKGLLKNLKKNDEIVTGSGIHGTIVNVKDTTIVVRVDDNVKIEMDKEAVSIVKNQKSVPSA